MVTGLAAGLYLVFGPTYSGCQSSTVTSSGAVIGKEVCRQASMWELQHFSGFPAPYLFIAVWSLAPLLGFAAAWIARERATRIRLGGLALAIEASVLISFGAAPFFIPTVLPLVLITFIALLSTPQTHSQAKSQTP